MINRKTPTILFPSHPHVFGHTTPLPPLRLVLMNSEFSGLKKRRLAATERKEEGCQAGKRALPDKKKQ